MNKYKEAAKLLSLVQKAGARHSARDNDLVQQMHDRACDLGAKCNCGTPTHPMLKAMVYRHPGHPNQKVHGNRFGGYEVTKESLRRLKGDKEARQKYKDSARKRNRPVKLKQSNFSDVKPGGTFRFDESIHAPKHIKLPGGFSHKQGDSSVKVKVRDQYKVFVESK